MSRLHVASFMKTSGQNICKWKRKCSVLKLKGGYEFPGYKLKHKCYVTFAFSLDIFGYADTRQETQELILHLT